MIVLVALGYSYKLTYNMIVFLSGSLDFSEGPVFMSSF